MPMRSRYSLALGAACVAASADAAEREWSFDFGQGTAEYAIGSFAEGGDHLALYCAEGGSKPESVSLQLARGGFAATKPTPATFITDAGEVTVALDAQGWAEYPDLATAADFQRLWRLLATAKTLRIAYGPGDPMQLPVAGAAELLGGTVCPRQLAS